MRRIGIVIVCMFLGFTLASAQEKAEISVSETTHNFGTVYEEDGDANCEFIITNTGTAPLELTRVTASCGCTTPNWTREPIAPGKTGVVKVTYSTRGRISTFSKSVSIFSNAQEAPFVVYIKGEVVQKTSADLQPTQAPVSIEPKAAEIKQAAGKDNIEKTRKRDRR